MQKIIALIMVIALEVGVDKNLAVSVAITENPALDPATVGVTGDLGIMQLNPDYLDHFVSCYWDKPGIFDWSNPEHNIYVGLRHLRYLIDIPAFNVWQAVIAYNCGEYAVLSGAPPNKSIDYANAVFFAWQERQGIR